MTENCSHSVDNTTARSHRSLTTGDRSYMLTLQLQKVTVVLGNVGDVVMIQFAGGVVVVVRRGLLS